MWLASQAETKKRGRGMRGAWLFLRRAQTFGLGLVRVGPVFFLQAPMQIAMPPRAHATTERTSAAIEISLGALLVALASFLCYVRARERQGTPIWSRYKDTEKGAGAGGDGASSASSAETEFSEASLK